MAVFLLVRSVFVALTLIAPSPIDPQKPAPFFNSIFYGGDLFFSGHTGLPFGATCLDRENFSGLIVRRAVYIENPSATLRR